MNEDNVTRYYAALLSAGGAWLRGHLSIDQLNQLNRLPTQPAGIPLTDYQSKSLLAMARQISAQNGETLASYDRLITTMEVAEKVGEGAGYAAGIAALGQVGFVVGKQLLKRQLTKAAWTVAKTATVVAAGMAVDKGAEVTARALGASEQTIKGIRLATLVVTVILVHRRAPAAVDDAAKVRENPVSDEIEGETTGPATPPDAPVATGGSGLPASVPKNNLVGTAADEVVLEVQDKLRVIRDTAVDNVRAGTGLASKGRSATRLAGMSPTDPEYPKAFGSAVHDEAFKLIEAEQAAGRLPKDLVTNTGVPQPKFDLPSSHKPRIPDIRLSLGNGREAVWDITTKAEAGALKGHVDPYATPSFVDYAADLPYER